MSMFYDVTQDLLLKSNNGSNRRDEARELGKSRTCNIDHIVKDKGSDSYKTSPKINKNNGLNVFRGEKVTRICEPIITIQKVNSGVNTQYDQSDNPKISEEEKNVLSSNTNSPDMTLVKIDNTGNKVG